MTTTQPDILDGTIWDTPARNAAATTVAYLKNALEEAEQRGYTLEIKAAKLALSGAEFRLNRIEDELVAKYEHYLLAQATAFGKDIADPTAEKDQP